MVRHPPPWPRRTMEANMNGTGPKAITPITAKATQDGEAAGDSSPVPPETSADALAWLAKRKAAEEKVTREAAPAVPVSKAPAPLSENISLKVPLTLLFVTEIKNFFNFLGFLNNGIKGGGA